MDSGITCKKVIRTLQTVVYLKELKKHHVKFLGGWGK